MKITGLHLLLTSQCTFACDHCFVWGSPWQSGVMTVEDVRSYLEQAKELGSVEGVYFEGGEPFLYAGTLLKSVQIAVEMGFQAGIVSNAYWAVGLEDALQTLKPFAGLLTDLTVSSDLFHYSEKLSRQAQHAQAAAAQLGIPTGMICINRPDEEHILAGKGKIDTGESGVMYRGRAAEKLSMYALGQPWERFDTCPHEDLREPGRVHLDPFGNIHLCQGIVLGNVRQTPLREICAAYHPEAHPICGPLLEGGPTGLVRRYELAHAATYADACHLCFTARSGLRKRFPEYLRPDSMYGEAVT
jgi:MoaA/NifB/PqqE/SkfB family radical SAM enzyme